MKKQMEILIDLVLNNEETKIGLDGVYPSDVEKYLKTKFNEVDKEIDTNGWQYDFWVDFTCDNKKFMLTGSGWYGQLEFSMVKNND